MTTALLLALAWAISLQSWLVFEGIGRSFAYALLDLILAYMFLKMSRGKWFPVPLFFLHLVLVVYHLTTGIAGLKSFWIGAWMNRAFDAALFYVIGCGLYIMLTRIYREEH